MSIFDTLSQQAQPQTNMNPMQKLQALKQNPSGMLQQAGFNVPQDMTNPQQIIQHLIQSGQVPQNRYTQVLQMLGRRQNAGETMFRATTPVHTYTFDVDPETTFKTILITYAQKNKIIFEKSKDDLTFEQTDEGYAASVKLTQQETRLFNARDAITVQVRALTYEDEAIAFDKQTFTVKDVLNDVVLS